MHIPLTGNRADLGPLPTRSRHYKRPIPVGALAAIFTVSLGIEGSTRSRASSLPSAPANPTHTPRRALQACIPATEPCELGPGVRREERVGGG